MTKLMSSGQLKGGQICSYYSVKASSQPSMLKHISAHSTSEESHWKSCGGHLWGIPISIGV